MHLRLNHKAALVGLDHPIEITNDPRGVGTTHLDAFLHYADICVSLALKESYRGSVGLEIDEPSEPRSKT